MLLLSYGEDRGATLGRGNRPFLFRQAREHIIVNLDLAIALKTLLDSADIILEHLIASFANRALHQRITLFCKVREVRIGSLGGSNHDPVVTNFNWFFIDLACLQLINGFVRSCTGSSDAKGRAK